MTTDSSVLRLVQLIREGHQAAASEIWDRYAPRLQELARGWVKKSLSGGAYDEEDVAISAMQDFFQGIKENRFPDLRGGTDIWQLLAVISIRKANDRAKAIKAEKRGGGVPVNEISDVPAEQLTPDLELMMTEETQRLIQELKDPEMEALVLLKLEGYTNDEIAARLGYSRRTIQRMLKLVREIWEKMVK